MKGRCHTEWSQYWFCSHMTIKSLVWPYNSPRSGVTPVIRGWVRTVLTGACLQPHSPTRGLQPLRTAISWCSLCPFALSLKQGPSRPSAQWGTHPALQCQQDPVQHGTFLTCNGKVSERFLSMKCYFICYSKWSQITLTPSQLCHQTTSAQKFLFYSMPPQTHWYQEPVSTKTSLNFKSYVLKSKAPILRTPLPSPKQCTEI